MCVSRVVGALDTDSGADEGRVDLIGPGLSFGFVESNKDDCVGNEVGI